MLFSFLVGDDVNLISKKSLKFGQADSSACL